MIEILQPDKALSLIPKALRNKNPSYVNCVTFEREVNRGSLSTDHVGKIKEFMRTLPLAKLSYAQVHRMMVNNKLAFRDNGSQISVQYAKGIAQEVIKESGIVRELKIRIYKDSKIEKITKLLNDGISVKQVSEIVGAHYTYVMRIKKQLEEQKKIDEAKND